MSMLSSCTLTSLLAPTAAPRKKFSPAALELRTKQPAAASSSSLALLALPRAAPRVSTRALRLVCHAYDILPTVLLNPSVGDHGNWKINKDKHHITLEFDVGEGTKEDSLSVRAEKDHQTLWLVISYTGDKSDKSPASLLNNVRLQMPPSYEEKNVMRAEILPDGWLQIVIAKPKQKTGPNKVTKPRTIFQANTDGKTTETTQE